MIDRDKLLHENRVKANLIVTKCMRIILIILLIIWGANTLGLFGMDVTSVTLCFASCGLIMLTPTLFIDVLNVQHKIVNYIVVFCTVLTVGVLATFMSFYVYPLMLFPLFIASMYCDRALVIFAAVSNCIMTVISSILGIYVSLTESTFVNACDVKDALILIALPSVCIVAGMSVIAFFIVDRNSKMLNEAIEGKLELQHNQKELIYAFAEISENKSKFTGEHIKRVAEYMKVLGRASGFTEEYIEKLSTASMMHDIGKLMISEDILDKPAKLTDEEYAIMKNHVLYGEALLHNTTGDIMNMSRTIALQHHEKWDGTGYLGMKGTDIAYIARLMAVADVFDALMSKRYYKDGWNIDEAYKEIVKCSGTHFDPDVVQLFVDNFDEFKKIVEDIPDQQIY